MSARAPTTDFRRQLLLEMLQGALEAVDGRRCVQRALADRRFEQPVWTFAIGKAACAMAQGASDALGDQIKRVFIATKDGHVPADARFTVLRVAKDGTHVVDGNDAALRPLVTASSAAGTSMPYTSPGVGSASRVEIFESAHPVPDERSIAAGEALCSRVAELPSTVHPLFLISGGASSIVEALVAGVTLNDLQRLNAEGLAAGLDIGALNERRRTLSRIKGGGLTMLLRGRRATALFISDVPTDDPAVIGSGLLGPASEGPDNVERLVVASIDHAVEAVSQAANRHGLQVRADHSRFASEADRLAVRFAHELRMQSEPVAVWGGESVMQLPESPGCGGRNQHLALAAARLIAGHDDLLLLAIGTDGTDGPTHDAGALVDGDTCARLTLGEMDIDDCLRRADSGTALAVTGDLVHTGPTGTNVGDLVIGLKLPKTGGDSLNATRDGDVSRVL
jgi:hydroxypyruvate reductase